MVSEERAPPDRLAGLRAALEQLGPAARHGFVVLVSLIERLHGDGVRVGGAGPFSSEPLRFRHDPGLGFHTSDIAGLKLVQPPPANVFDSTEARAHFEVTTTFLGLSGSVTPMPLHLAEEILHEDPDHPQKSAFLDVFHHRLLSLLYRLLVKFDYPREFLAGGADDWSRRVLALAGVPDENATKLPRWRLLRLAPLLATRARNAHGLTLAIEDILGEDLEGARVDIEEFVGAWVALEPGQQAQLGKANSRLGAELILGQRVFDRGGKFRMSIGPLTNRVFDRLRPEGDLFPVLREVVGMMNPNPLAYDLELVLAVGEAPPFQLSSRGGVSRMGQNTWLGGRPKDETRMTFEIEG